MKETSQNTCFQDSPSTNPALDEEIKTLIFAAAKAIRLFTTVHNNIDSEGRCRSEHLHGTLANLLLNEVKTVCKPNTGDPE